MKNSNNSIYELVILVTIFIIFSYVVLKIEDKLFPVNIEKPITILNTEVKTKLSNIETKYKKYDIKFYIDTNENITIMWTYKNKTYGNQLSNRFKTDDRYLELVIEKITQKVDKQ